MLKLNTMDGHNRESTQDLLISISEAVKKGENEFDIVASGQHDIGGPLWHPEGKELFFRVTNPGQRVGSMCLPHTEILVEGSAPADVGWLNSGGMITVLGDAGDTAGHGASSGKIFIGGRAGARSGSLMKHDPIYDEPELWILKNVGSFAFEFMGGGRAIVCGVDLADGENVLGARPCVGMVGGTVYVRGPLGKGINAMPLEEEDIAFLAGGMEEFLTKIKRAELREELSDWSKWQKITPATLIAANKSSQSALPCMKEFRQKEWVKGGIFSDVAKDDFVVHTTVMRDLYRLRVPSWDNGRFAAPCEYSCPTGIPTQRRYALLREGKEEEALRLVLEYTPFPGSVCGSVCPNPCMEGCTRGGIDEAIQIGQLGFKSADLPAPVAKADTDKKIAVIGGGVAGLSAAWQLALLGHNVTVYDEAAHIGGKLEQVIPRERLFHDLLLTELKRIESVGVKFVTSCKVDKDKFNELRQENDAVIVACGGTKSRFFPWEGKERLTMGLDFLKAINRGEKPATGKRVVVIGAGNSGMDTCRGAYQCGAESVIAVDVQRPAAFAHEIEYIESLGGKIVWPFVTEKITSEGIYANDGRFIPADQVIVSIGEEPETDFLPENEGIEKFRGSWLVTKNDKSILPGVFAAGDVIKPGRLTDAIGDGRKAAAAVHTYLTGEEALSFPLEKIPPERLSLAYFDKCHHDSIGDPISDKMRCVSCGRCRDCKMCLESCPEKAIARTEQADGSYTYISDPAKCIGCGICAGVCPCGIWTIEDNHDEIHIYSTGTAV